MMCDHLSVTAEVNHCTLHTLNNYCTYCRHRYKNKIKKTQQAKLVNFIYVNYYFYFPLFNFADQHGHGLHQLLKPEPLTGGIHLLNQTLMF